MEGKYAPSGGMLDHALPSSAPPLIWIIAVAVMLLWWLWPWLSKLSTAPTKPVAAAREAARQPLPTESTAAGAQTAADDDAGAQRNIYEVDRVAAPVMKIGAGASFDLRTEFAIVFADAAALIKEALYAQPQSPEYTAATSGLHRAADVIDRIFQAWGSDEDVARACRLRETADSFQSAFGEHRAGKAARSLLGVAGFDRQSDGFWTFPSSEPLTQFRAMSVRLCLQKHMELQKKRGRQVWTQTSNDDVVPSLEDGFLQELCWLFHAPCKSLSAPSPSLKEMAAEAMLRAKLNEHRTESGQLVPLAHHEGLSSAARCLANTWRISARSKGGDEARMRAQGVDDEAQMLLKKLALPPGCSVARLDYVSDDLPHVFGLSSTTGNGSNDGDNDKAAVIIANEAINTWTARGADHMAWPSALIFGVGASLDYTINRGFLVAFLAGFEGIPPVEQLGSGERKERLDMKQRLEAAPKTKGLTFGAKVHGMGSLHDPPENKRRRPGPGGG